MRERKIFPRAAFLLEPEDLPPVEGFKYDGDQQHQLVGEHEGFGASAPKRLLFAVAIGAESETSPA